jgi:hypothetical protein
MKIGRIVKINMVCGGFESRVSSSLTEAIDVEQTISDLLLDDPKRERYERDINTLQDAAADVSSQLTRDELLLVRGVAKAFWYLRVTNDERPDNHPEFCSSMIYQVSDALSEMDKISDPVLQGLSSWIISKVDLPAFARTSTMTV